jgi:hypothetical protein
MVIAAMTRRGKVPTETTLPRIIVLGLAALVGCGDADQGVKSVDQIYGGTTPRPASSASRLPMSP